MVTTTTFNGRSAAGLSLSARCVELQEGSAQTLHRHNPATTAVTLESFMDRPHAAILTLGDGKESAWPEAAISNFRRFTSSWATDVLLAGERTQAQQPDS